MLAKCLSFGDPADFTLPTLYKLVQHLGVKGIGLKDWIKGHGFNPAYPDVPYIIDEWAAITAVNEGDKAWNIATVVIQFTRFSII
ncbi:MAG TPA: hypothetical protein ENI62_05310 [Gammaproteobacteria bacterium]|nr:hypothetical protein [Gammaproteobacteria bacterium]